MSIMNLFVKHLKIQDRKELCGGFFRNTVYVLTGEKCDM